MSLYTLRHLLNDCSSRLSRTKCAIDKKHETLEEIWRALNDWIDSRFSAGKGIHIATFATISWESCTNSRNQSKLRPLFLLSDTFAKTYNLQQRKAPLPPQLASCEDINFTKIAIKFSRNLTKDLVFCGVRDLLQKIGEVAASGTPMSIAFNVGRLIAKNRCISMIFDPLRFPKALEEEITRSMIGSPPSVLGNLADFDIPPEDHVDSDTSQLRSGRQNSDSPGQQLIFEGDGVEALPTQRSNPYNLIHYGASLEEELELFGIKGSPAKGNPVMESAYKRHIASLSEDVDREAKYAFDLQLQQKRDLDTVALEDRMRRLCAEDLQRQIVLQMDQRKDEKKQEKGVLKATDPSACSFYSVFWFILVASISVWGSLIPFQTVAGSMLMERDFFRQPPVDCRRCGEGSYASYTDCLEIVPSCPPSPPQAWPLPKIAASCDIKRAIDQLYCSSEPPYIRDSEINCDDPIWKAGPKTQVYCERKIAAEEEATRVMSLPSMITLIASPLFGYIAGRIPHRGWITLLASGFIVLTQFFIATTRASIRGLLFIQGASSCLFFSSVWPSIPYVVEEHHVGTAYGAIVAMGNLVLAVLPMVVAGVFRIHEQYLPTVQLLLTAVGLVAFGSCGMIYVLERQHGRLLNPQTPHIQHARRLSQTGSLWGSSPATSPTRCEYDLLLQHPTTRSDYQSTLSRDTNRHHD